jgi:hypothetical protein
MFFQNSIKSSQFSDYKVFFHVNSALSVSFLEFKPISMGFVGEVRGPRPLTSPTKHRHFSNKPVGAVREPPLRFFFNYTY